MSEKMLKVGFGRVDITPDYSLPLAGFGNTLTRMSKGCIDQLCATAIVMTGENDETVLAVTVDVVATPNYIVEPLFASITAATGIPADHSMVSATHTHSGPDMGSPYDDDMKTWKKDYIEGITAAAVAAMADRVPTTLKVGDLHTERMNFVRHYILENGTYAGDNFGDFKSAPIAGYATPADTQMQLVRFVREGKKDVLLVNWQAHTKMAGTIATEDGRRTRAYMSADFVAPCRDYVEANSDVYFAFFQGAAGNLNPITKITEEMFTTEYNAYGKLLGDIVVKGLANLKDAPVGQVQARRVVFKGQVDHTEDHMIEDARKIEAMWKETNDYRKCADAGLPYNIISPYHAGAIIRRFEDPSTEREMPLTAACIGPVGFVTAPYEMFDTNGKFVKDNSPCPITVVMSCSNGANGYIASEPTFEYGSYEVHNRVFVRGTAEVLADTMVSMIKDMKDNEQ